MSIQLLVNSVNLSKKGVFMKKFTIILSFMLIFLVSSVCADSYSDIQTPFMLVETEDEFGDKTGIFRLGAVCTGEFSNTATTDSELGAVVFVDDKNTCYLTIYEYMSYQVSFYRDDLIFSVKDGKGEKTSFTVKTSGSSSKFVDCNKLIPLLKKEGILKVVIKKGTTTYKFSVDATNFNELYGKLK